MPAASCTGWQAQVPSRAARWCRHAGAAQPSAGGHVLACQQRVTATPICQLSTVSLCGCRAVICQLGLRGLPRATSWICAHRLRQEPCSAAAGTSATATHAAQSLQPCPSAAVQVIPSLHAARLTAAWLLDTAVLPKHKAALLPAQAVAAAQRQHALAARRPSAAGPRSSPPRPRTLRCCLRYRVVQASLAGRLRWLNSERHFCFRNRNCCRSGRARRRRRGRGLESMPLVTQSEAPARVNCCFCIVMV